ncbi:hypothetical protein [Nocardia sp. XZ_19_385]|uniref:terpene synthase family protein n=1 Tax=Nocardia sp. XZ_19_385 TaxID=2769488 RepID=UPI00188FC9DC|nr:hypothetical protein [Nocardia sp. XZ_19_385]
MAAQSLPGDRVFDESAPVTLAFYCPIPSSFHPNAQLVQDRSFDWMERFRLFGDASMPRRSALATESARVTGSMTPGAPDDLLLFVMTFMYWGFLVDDLFDTGTVTQRRQQYRELAPRLMRAVEAPLAQVHDDPAQVALLRDMRRYLDLHLSPALVRWWVASYQTVLLGVALELDDALNETLPGIDEYLFTKMLDGAARAVTTTVEVCGGTELPAAERESPAVTALTHAAGLLMTLFADVSSHTKDSVTDRNIINVLRCAGRSCDQALDDAVELCDRIMALFLELRTQTLPRVSPSTSVYLTNLGTSLSGVLDWSAMTARYAAAGRPCVTRTDQPPRAGLTPPPYVNIAWWWDQLDS